jgi:Rps23 Pro-64 3,4-dihydroxylase Tpa1-like proline 4-hydroxylase
MSAADAPITPTPLAIPPVKVRSFAFDPEALRAVASEHHDAYVSAAPFPHTVIDDLFPPEILDAVLDEFPSRDDVEWTVWDTKNELKFVCSDGRQLGPQTQALMAELNSSVFVTFLEQLTGIEHLIPDPHFHAAGIFDVPQGGFLDVHADFSANARLRLERRINVLLYLNHDWKDEYNGQLELWSNKPREKVESILPIFNRVVVFNTTGQALHGHPQPIQCPDGMSRKVLSAYYFTNGGVPLKESMAAHGVLFDDEIGEGRYRLKRMARMFVPPIVAEAAREVRQRVRNHKAT